MKFSRLIGKTEKIAEKYERGRRIKPDQLAELQHLLNEKIARYESRLKADTEVKDRAKLQKRLRVVRAQLQKTRDLQPLD